MTTDGPHRAESGEPNASVGDMANTLAADVRALVRTELRTAWGEIQDAAGRSATAVALLGGAGACGILAAQTGSIMLLRLLEAKLPKPVAAAVLTALYGGAAVGLSSAGLRALRSARESAVHASAHADDTVRRAT